VKASIERELKLEADEGFVLPDLGGAPLETRVFVSTYHDTEDGSLARSGITLRRRHENGVSLWQLKLPAEDGRRELEERGGPARAPERMRQLLAAHLRNGDLHPVARLRTRRAGVLAGGAEVTVDDVAILDGRRVTGSFREIEVELRDGTGDSLTQLGRALRDAGARAGDSRPKLFRVLAPDNSAPLDPVHARIREQLVEILAYDPGTRLGEDPEDLHQMRVAIRRLRALLRTIRPLVGRETTEALRTELGWIGGLLGEVRDLDVMLERFEAEIAELDVADRRALKPLLRRLERERERHRKELLGGLDSARYFGLLDELELAVRTLPVGDPKQLPDLAADDFRRLRRAVRKTGDAPADDELHKLRIRGKRARYAAELVNGRRAGRFVTRAKQLQDVLGDHQDAIVAEERLRSLLGDRTSVPQALAVGRLVERERERRGEARASWQKTWKRLERSGRKAWM
jgi:CHAD domain-containing protein